MYIVERSKYLEKKSINLKVKKPSYNINNNNNNKSNKCNNVRNFSDFTDVSSDDDDDEAEDDDFFSVYSDSGNVKTDFTLTMNQLYALNELKCPSLIHLDQSNNIYLFEKQFDIPYNVSINNTGTILYVKIRSKYLDKRSTYLPNQDTIFLERQLMHVAATSTNLVGGGAAAASNIEKNNKSMLSLKSCTTVYVNGDDFLFKTYVKDDYAQYNNFAQSIHHYKRISNYKFIEYNWDIELNYMAEKYIFEISYIVVDELKEKSISIKCRNKLIKPNIFYMIYYAIKEYFQFQILQTNQIDTKLSNLDEFLCYNDEKHLLTYNQTHAILSMRVNELKKCSDELKVFCNYVNCHQN